jgi:hypothetical protein
MVRPGFERRIDVRIALKVASESVDKIRQDIISFLLAERAKEEIAIYREFIDEDIKFWRNLPDDKMPKIDRFRQCHRNFLRSKERNVAPGFPENGIAPFLIDRYRCTHENKSRGGYYIAMNPTASVSSMNVLEACAKVCPRMKKED